MYRKDQIFSFSRPVLHCVRTYSPRILALPLLLGSLLTGSLGLHAQTGGQGALEGVVLDPTGAAVPNATITATNQASGVANTRTSSGAGLYSLTPLIPGVYTITVTAPGFSVLQQKNIEVNGLAVTGYNPKLVVGASNEVTVTEAPPQLQTTDAAIESVITQDTYESLPIIMNNQQRDPTSLATLAPGALGGGRTPIFSGTGNYLA